MSFCAAEIQIFTPTSISSSFKLASSWNKALLGFGQRYLEPLERGQSKALDFKEI